LRPLKVKNQNMSDQNSEEKENKTPEKMARLAWPKAKYGVVLAIIVIIVINLIYYKDIIFSFLK
tara:strand:+ start:265 stop:456 length:192 start_codon:yes stop_codon:yes gene_type:complete